ncbi:hypothetical protein QQS21_001898 [Conoideocrella luteorostrata]|uniref:Carrier domain-containing protein n=1 Tax=Conoideocrella luteorostrata TaxID=1105319 RepID=A0AAJ0CYN6_9HYPO|nr:hypothetical protein QQS21_001898 [Conoideocrella luteorostrata]
MRSHTLQAQPATPQATTPAHVIKHVGSLCHKRPEIGLLGLVNAVWAIIIWQHTGLEDVRFVTATTTSASGRNNDASTTYHVCAVNIDGGTGIAELVRLAQNGTKDLTPDQLPLLPRSSRHDGVNAALLQSMTRLSTDRTHLSTNTPHTSTKPNAARALIELVAVPSTAGDLEVALHSSDSVAGEQHVANDLLASFSHVISLVTEAAGDNDRLDALDLVSQHDKTKLWAWNSAQLSETVEECVHTLFVRRAREQPDMPAVDAWDGRFTYSELDAISSRIAEWLMREERVQPESIVPLCFEKSCWAIAALMGVIKAGGAIVFIDPANPVSRRRDILDQIDGRFLLASPSQAEAWEKETAVRTIVVDAQFVAQLPGARQVPEPGVAPANLLYLIFTSGSTGRPKGCLIPHEAFVSGALQHAAKSNLGRGTRVMQLASYSFDVSMLEILTSLISGACVCTPDMASLAQGLHPIMQQFSITWAFLTPSMVKLLRPDLVPTLKTLVLGGEPLHKIDIETWAPHLQLINGYGPSECSVAAAGDPHLTPSSDPSNVGRALGGLCWIVDAENHDSLVPLGAVGELLISGPILARGYLNDAEKTAAAFIENPAWTEGWSLTPQVRTEPMRFYKTGDLARFNSDGTIQILGRKDTQIKLRGLRIELGEVEHNIAKHPHVKHVTAFLPKTGLCKEKIVTVICLGEFASESKPGQSDAPINVLLESERPAVREQADAVRSHLRDCVPEYMIPAVWIVIEQWPLLVSGKLDRKRIVKWVLDMDQGLYNSLMGFLVDNIEEIDSTEDGEQEAEINDGLSEIERVLRDIFARALNSPAQNMPLDKSFIGLGGDSLAAMRVVSEATNAGLTMTVKDMLQSKGIVDLAIRVAQNSDLNSSTKASHASFQLSRAQKLLLSNMAGTDNVEARQSSDGLLLALDSTVSPTKLQAAITNLVNRHSILTARLVWKDGAYSQSIATQTENSYRFEEHAIDKPEEIAAIIATAQRAVMISGPVFSADLIKSGTEQQLLLTAHRAVVDSESWAIIIRELDMMLGRNAGLPVNDKSVRSVSFQNWVEIERQASELEAPGKETRAKSSIFEPSKSDLDYWGVKGRTQTVGDIIEQATEIDEGTVALLSSSKVHEALRTNAVDFLVASLLLSFSQIFADRESVPTLSVWEDERASASQEFAIDLATTVGQFETASLVVINTGERDNNDGWVNFLKRSKDARRMGASSIPSDKQASASTSEISLRYKSLSNVFDRPNALLKRETRSYFVPWMLGARINIPQTSVINITADAVNGRIQLTFSYDRHIKDSARVASWIAAVQPTIISLVSRMLVASVEYTLSDFPLLNPLSYEGLDELVKERLSRIGLGSGPDSLAPLIEDIYPCSPLQQDLLLSQNRTTGLYEYYHIAELKPRDFSASVDVDRLVRAWSQVVQRHASLRTVFVENADGQTLFDQIVLAHIDPNVSILDFDSSTEDVQTLLANQSSITFQGPQPPHRMTICRFSRANHVVIKLEINHAIVDGASAGVLLRDILQAYDGQANAWGPALPFRKYIAHIRRTPVDSSLEFWASYLKGQTATIIPKLATLETAGHEQVAERRLSVVDVPLASEGVSDEKLSAFCRGASVTPANVFQAAWALVLRHYAESPEDVCFGFLSAGRDAPLPGIQDGVGAFLTMLVSRLRFVVDRSKQKSSTAIYTLLDAVQATAGDYVKALPHQHVGLSNIQHALMTSGSPLFNTIIAFNRDVESPAGSSLLFKSIGDYEPDEYAVVVDVTFAESHGVRATLRHWTDYLTTEQVRSIASAYGRAVEVIISHPDTPIGEVSIVGAHHMERFRSFNAHPLPRADRLVFTRFEEHAHAQPHAQAVCAWDGEWTYAQLDDMSTRLAHFLRTLGVGPEVIVPHCFPKSGWAVVTCLAIVKAGGAFVGLDPTHPKKRLVGLVQDVGAKVVCLAPENLHLFEESDGLRIVVVAPEVVANLSPKQGRPCTSVRPDNAACVVFTSGTTGRPKAVVVEHASMSSLSDLMGSAVHIGPEARVFQFASYTFDTSNQDTFTTLQRGGCLCVPSEEDRVNDPAGAIVRLRANHAHLTSTVISLLRPETVPQLKWLFSAGESLTRENVQVWAPAVELYNSYGPAEACVAVTCTPTRLDPLASPVNIGKSFGGWTWIVDATDHQKLVPLGAVGELLLEGPLLARHYLNDAPRTAAAFVENPRWAKEMTPGRDRRFYRTGDLCRYNSDGSLTIIGRRDSQVKIHGQRVELDHIKYAVQTQLAEVSAQSLVSVDALTLPRVLAKDKTLVAFVQFLERDFDNSADNSLAMPVSDALSIEFSDLQRALKTILPNYMVPAMFVPIKETPRTNSGKLARNVLREIVSNLSDQDMARCMLQGDISYRKAPETEQEKMLQAVWAKVLSVPLEKVGSNDDFFQIGGDSVVAMRLAAAARTDGMSLTVADIFANPVLSKMAIVARTAKDEALEEEEHQAFDLVQVSSSEPSQDLDAIRTEAAVQCGVRPDVVTDLYPCTPLQEGLIALSMRQTGAYKDQRIFRLTDENYDVGPFRRALDAVVRAEPILRTRFVSTGAGVIHQAVLNVAIAWVERNDLKAYLQEDLDTPVTYGSALIRLALINEEDGSRYIVWSGHHALCDGFSMDITFEQISYAMAHNGTVSPKPVPFKNFIRHLSEEACDESARNFWEGQFPATGSVPPKFPPVPAGHQVVPHRACRSKLNVTRAPGSKISVTNYLRGAWGLIVARHLDSPDVLFGVTLSGRNAPVRDISTMNGPTMTTVPFRMSVPYDGETTVAQYLESVHAQALEMTPFEHTGLQNIRRLNDQARAAIDNMAHRFAVEPIAGGETLEGMESVSVALPGGFYTDPLVIRNYAHDDGTIEVEAKYDYTLISDQKMQRLLRQYVHVVRQLLIKPDMRLADVELLGPEDVNDIMEWNGKVIPETVQECVHHLVAKRTQKSPHAEAVCAWDGAYTFAELDSVTERLAAHLQSLGIGPEVVVALCFDKSKWNVVSMLSILKAGGCYTALDPAYPAARMQDILQAVKTPLVLCSPVHAEKLNGMSSCVLPISDYFLESLQAPVYRVTSTVQPSNMAFIVFTSGSTGKPKGAVVEHRSICSMQHYEGPYVGMGPDTRTLQFASHVFDVSNSEVFTTLVHGGCVCVPSEEERMNDITGALNRYRANWSFQVPTMADTLDPDFLPGLKYLALGGEAISQGLCDKWAGRVTLLNSYGPSECSIWTSVSHLLPGTKSPNNIGRGLGCRTWVTDQNDHNRLVAIGCVGELCVEGPIVTRGYVASPKHTAAAYIDNPAFAGTLGIREMRMYKTGDLVKYDSDGSLLYVGRKDNQVKIRGQRMELGEVELNIIANNIEADSVVVEKIFQGGDKERVALAAFFMLTSERSGKDSGYTSEDEDNKRKQQRSLLQDDMEPVRDQLVALRRTLTETIPPYMVPSFFIPLRRMPVTQTGKKDRKSLRALGASLNQDQLRVYAMDDAGDNVAAEDGGRPCATDAEKRLRTMWADVLGIAREESISAHDSFFLRGGDSIQAMRLAAAARRVGKTLTVADMFRMPRLFQMAELWERDDGDHQDAVVVPFSLLKPDTIGNAIQEAACQCNVKEDDIEDIYLASPLQEGLMAVSTRKPGAYVTARIFDLPAHIDMERFKSAWQEAADKFPILRTRIILGRTSESLQVVLKEKMTWDVINGEESAETFLARRGIANIVYGGRLCAFAIDAKSRKFAFALHHALYDGWSASVLLGAVEKIYKGDKCPVGPAFNVFIQHLSQTDKNISDDFWRDQLSGTPAHFPKLPNKAYEPKNTSIASHTIQLPASDNLPTGILKSTLLRAAWALVSARHAESNDITFGAAQSGRDCAVRGIDEVIGPIVATVPIRIRIDKKESIISFLGRIQEQSVAMIAHQHAGVQTLRQLGKDVHGALEFTTLFEFGDDSQPKHDFITEVQRPELLDGFWSYPIVMECHLAGDGLTINIVARHDPNVVPTHQMNWICKQFSHVVDQLCSLTTSTKGSTAVDEVARTVQDLDIFGPYDMATVDAWNARWPHGEIDGKTVHEAIAEHSQLRPKQLALSGWDGDMTYAQLESYATKLAKMLVNIGVGPEVLVPLCFDKSKWAIVASVAVIKAGGVLVHLGPTHPANRRKEILQTIEASFVLVSPQHISLFENAAVSIISIDEESMDQLADVDVQLPQVNPSNAVYVCFTSGSTGRPKGIVVEHRNLRMSAQAHGAQFNVTTGTRVFQFSAYTFDIGLGDIFITLQRGATLCTPSEFERLNELADAINKYKTNFMSVTPSVAKLLTPGNVPTLRTLVLGGEAPTQDNVKTWSDNLDLVLIWGPAETTIYASATPPTTPATSAQSLGNPMGSLMWLCDPTDHNKLVPLGCVGEIVVEGPLVSRGYLKDECKTASAYIQDPIWAGERDKDTKPRRMYKTGDLARYGADGYMLFAGRKDNQVKLHGQRMELEEIEHAMLAHETVRQAVARIPRDGPLKDKLVAMLSIHGFSSQSTPVANQISLLEKPNNGADVAQELAAVCRVLQDNLPSYMVPTIWICVENLPLSANSKIDRKSVDGWLQEVDQATYEHMLRNGGGGGEGRQIIRPSTPVEQTLCDVISRILGLESDNINLGRSFLNLGGDSVSAMQLRSKARKEGVAVTMQNIIKSKSLVELASKAVFTEPPAKEVSSPHFGLSPIQKMYFDLVGSAPNANVAHFDQSILLQINRKVTPKELQMSLGQIVQRHSMLRARYSKREDGEWYQFVAEDNLDSFHFNSHDVEDGFEVSRILEFLAGVFDIRKGPVFCAHLFNLRSEQKQLLFVRAHHLVVDVVSWHILLGDLEVLIATGGFTGPAPLSFQSWLRMQKDMAESLEPADLLPFPSKTLPIADYEYWGMGDGKPNVYGDATTAEFFLDKATTAKLLGSSNAVLNNAPVDTILAALIQSYVAVFPNRASPAIFSEGHGRESWSDDVDPSGTVGWFTTMSPLHVPDVQSDILTTVQTVKDLRRRLRANGMSYFSSRYLTRKGQAIFKSHFEMEIMFNYLGRSSEVGRENAMLSPAELPNGATFDKLVQDENLPRWSLFDIVALIVGGRARITFSYNENMRHQDRIQQWIATSQTTLSHAIESLHNSENFPRTNLLSAIERQALTWAIKPDEVEGIYPCAGVQGHMLATREKHPDRHLYEMEFGYRATGPNGASVEVEMVNRAWQQVVRRHAALRTVLIRNTSKLGCYEQVVLRDFRTEVPVIECASEQEMKACMNAYRNVDYSLSSTKPHHQLTLFVTGKQSEKVLACKIEIDHVLTDGVSMALLLHDFELAYDGKLSTGSAPSFGSYALWLDGMSQEKTMANDVAYWTEFDQSTEASHIPSIEPSSPFLEPQARHYKVKAINLDQNTTSRLPAFCAKHGVTMATVFQTAWGLVLKELTDSSKTLFAFITANRDAPVAGVGEMVGPLINILLCRIDLSKPDEAIGEVLNRARDDFLESLEHQYGLSKMEHMWQDPSWNSLMSLQYMDSRVAEKATTRGGVSFDMFSARDPVAWDVSIGLQISSRGEGITVVDSELGYWSDVLTDAGAGYVKELFEAAVEQLLNG